MLSSSNKKIIALLHGIGVLLFSGSIYLLTIDQLLGMDLHFLGPVTPVVGLLLMS